MNTNIDERVGWPDELKVLLEQYPRASWRSNASPMAQFWLDKHDYFRQHCRTLDAITIDFREGRKSASDLAAHSVPRLQTFLGNLHGHHQIEDHHYFPTFRAAEERLARGFDVLASDHELLHNGLQEIVEKVNALIGTLQPDTQSATDTQKHAADAFVTTFSVVSRRLMRHLDDEEDLIIPVMLDQN